MLTLLLMVACGQLLTVYGINGSCGAGWVEREQSCYFFSDVAAQNWLDAKDACTQRDSYLAEINDASENAFLVSKLVEIGDDFRLVGATDSIIDGTWIWSVSGQKMNFSSWLPGHVDGGQDCLSIQQDGWNDRWCEEPGKYICEKSLYDVNECASNPCNNGGQCANGLYRFTCTCADGWSGTTCQTEGCGVGWIEHEQSCYFFSDNASENWLDAKDACTQRDSYLAEINDASENAFLTSKHVEIGGDLRFVGATDSIIDGTWIWSFSGQKMNFSSWLPGHVDGSQNCLAIQQDGWNDRECEGPEKYICEKSLYASLSVESCTASGVEFTVYSGQASGVTYIGGTTSNSSECIKTLAGTPSESFQLDFGTCGVYPTLDSSTNSIEVLVIVQRNAVVRTGDDLIYTIKCTYGDKENIIVTAKLWAISVDVTSQIVVETFPMPIMTLYKIDDPLSNTYIQMSNDTVVVLGTPLRQKITLDKHLPNYKLLVETCSMEVRRIPEDDLLGDLLLLDNETSCSRLGDDIYPEFSYLTDNVTRNGNQSVVPYALNEFEAFIPMIPIIDLVGNTVKLVLSCRCSVCLGNNTACDPPTCGSNRRRRVAVDKNSDVKNYDNLIGTFQIQIDDGKQKIIKEPNVHSTEAEVVGSINFWAIFISAVAGIVVTISIVGVILHMKKVRGHSGNHGNRRTTEMNKNNFSNGGWPDGYVPRDMPRSGPPMHMRQFQHHCFDISA